MTCAPRESALAGDDAQQIHCPQRGDRRGRQGGGLVVGDAAGDAGQRLELGARGDRRVLRVRAVRARHAEDAVAGVQVVTARRNPFHDTCEVDAQHVGICRFGGQPGQVVVVERVDPGIRHPQEEGVTRGRDGQVVDGRSLPEALDSERAHGSTHITSAPES
jgi:hypothetical protein